MCFGTDAFDTETFQCAILRPRSKFARANFDPRVNSR